MVFDTVRVPKLFLTNNEGVDGKPVWEVVDYEKDVRHTLTAQLKAALPATYSLAQGPDSSITHRAVQVPKSLLWRYKLNPVSRSYTKELLLDLYCDFPSINPSRSTQAYTYTYVAAGRSPTYPTPVNGSLRKSMSSRCEPLLTSCCNDPTCRWAFCSSSTRRLRNLVRGLASPTSLLERLILCPERVRLRTPLRMMAT